MRRLAALLARHVSIQICSSLAPCQPTQLTLAARLPLFQQPARSGEDVSCEVRIGVSATTPLNYLILIGHVDFLPALFGTLIVPPAVIGEMRHSKAPTSVAAWANRLPAWAEVKNPQTDLGLDHRLGPGEREAICLAVELKSALLVDEKLARGAAKEVGIPVLGTLAVLDLADEAGLLDFEQATILLQATTFRVEKALIATALAKVRGRKRIT